MNKEFFEALAELEKEKNIPVSYMLEKVELALQAAYRKQFGQNALCRVKINPEKKDIKVYSQKNVVEEVLMPECEIGIEEAKATLPKKYCKIGALYESEVKPKDFRRLSAAAAKSVIVQAIREGERRVQQSAYESKSGNIITATVFKYDDESGNYVLETDNGKVTLVPADQIPGDRFDIGDKIKVYVSDVNKEAKGPIVSLSRTNQAFIRRLFELEIPEIEDGTVQIMSISREAGSRTKVAVYTDRPDVDPVGACIGPHGDRINNILDEISGEKIDIVKYSDNPCEYIASALSPAAVINVTALSERAARAIVSPDQLSLAIGKEGQNVRLAARLTGFKIDIKAEGNEDY